jgi:hypothetical protein
VGALQGRLDVDEGRLRQQQLDLGPPAEPVGTHAVAQLGQQHAQRVSRLCGGVIPPTSHQQLIAGQWTATVEDQIGEHDPVQVDYTVAPSCIYRFSHTHFWSKHVHLQSNCQGTYYVKVIIAYGPDSGCIYMPPGSTATHSWSTGWPYYASRLDRVELR